LQHFNHEKVSILDGGLPRWEAEGLAIDTSIPSHINPHDLEQQNKKYQPIFSELLYATKPRIESYFIADIEEHFTEYKVEGNEKEGDVLEWKDMNENIEKAGKGDIILDARPSGRFDGSAPEPRAGLSSGHMPYSLNLPSPSVLSSESSTSPPYKTLLPKEELEKVFIGVLGKENWELVKKGERKVVNTCGSGMTVRAFPIYL
jgi:thiosulfate/3-mercaptopyruvate sulfurtransferase